MTGRRVVLGEERILETAQRVFQDDGLAALSARRLATELGVSQMAVYRYFESIGELKNALIDRILKLQLPPDDAHDSWQDWAESTFVRFWEMLCHHEDVFALLIESAYAGEATMHTLESVLRRLRSAGFEVEEAVVAFHALIGYTVGAAAMQQVATKQLRAITEEVHDKGLNSRWVQRFGQLQGDDFVEIQRHAPALAQFASSERFIAGLRTVLDGIEARRQGASPA